MTEKEVIDGIIEWLNHQPLWLKMTVNEILKSNKKPTEEFMLQMEQLLLFDGQHEDVEISSALFTKRFSKESNLTSLRLHSLYDFKGINKLNPRKPLVLDNDNLTIVYGRNGSGKSGYVRTLKQACGAKRVEELIPDVFAGKTAQMCKIDVIVDKDQSTIDWKPTDEINDTLRSIDIYDTSCSLSYVNAENEVTYQPKLMSFITFLTKLSTEMTARLEAKKVGLKTHLPTIDEKYRESTFGKRYQGYKIQKKFDDQFSDLTWSEGDNKELISLQASLLKIDDKKEVSSLFVKYRDIKIVIQELEKLKSFFSETKFNQRLSILTKIKKHESELKQISALLEDQHVDGVSSDLWRKLWNAAKEFSNQVAYTDVEYPNYKGEEKCVLCQQDLPDETKARFTSLESYATNESSKNLKAEKANLMEFDDSLDIVWSEALVKSKVDQIEMDAKHRTNLIRSFEEFHTLVEGFKTKLQFDELVLADPQESIAELKILSADLEKKLKALKESKTAEGRAALMTRILELQARKWLFDNKTTVKNAHKDILTIAKINSANKLCRSNKLSVKNSELSALLVSQQFIDNFQKELIALGAGNIGVHIEKTRTSKGSVYHAIRLKNAKINSKVETVLSEGEFRIVSLAAFLADVSEKALNAPFIFDDPISSLDADYEEKTIQRIVELSKTRQVIVFTHRISFLSLINAAANSENIKPNNISIFSEHWGTGEPGKSILDSQKPAKAINFLLGTELSAAKKVLENDGTPAYQHLAKSICGEFRNTLERIIENDLLNQIVMRYRRGVQTMGRLAALVKINQVDVDLIDTMMTKYSKYEHSQPEEIPNGRIEPDEIGADLQTIADWIKEFKARK